MKKLLAVAVISLGLVSCDNADKLRRECSVIMGNLGMSDRKEEAVIYVETKMGLSRGEVGGFCKQYLTE